ncbi:MAG: thiamine pyrophosphate-dependent enzyme [Synergistota bacterium]|nr:thiamine pyrophosphate-dependent enzyme [Synergistota bacterium]
MEGDRKILLGNEAIALGIVEAGCDMAAAYPGTPSSEILPSVAKWADHFGTSTVVEWGANEKVALETALGATYAGKRACAVMKQVGLNVAADPFMSAAPFDLDGGMLVVVSDDPGFHASQDDQDSRYFALYAKIPCFDPANAAEAREMVLSAFDLSQRCRVMAMLRPAVRIDHCRQDIETGDVVYQSPRADFRPSSVGDKVVLPGRLKNFLVRHNDRFETIRREFETDFGRFNYEIPSPGAPRLGIIAAGVSFSIARDFIRAGGRDDTGLLKIGTPVPLPLEMVANFVDKYDKVLVLEETFPVMEMQMNDKTGILCRWNDFVPKEGELLPEVIEELILRALGQEKPSAPGIGSLEKAREAAGLGTLKPRLCPGCSHRPAYFALRKALPDVIIAGDIGCYGLAVQQQGLDSIVCMGASVTVASGLYNAYRSDGDEPTRPIVATLGDSTFFHNGMTGLTTAVYNRHAFVLAILDNRITAMTGGQHNPSTGDKPRAGDEGVEVNLENAVRGCGVKHLRVLEPYDIEENLEPIREAWEYARTNREPSVLIFRHPCITILKAHSEKKRVRVAAGQCVGCRVCIDKFNCPGLAWNETTGKAEIDRRFCIDCGVCEQVCPVGAIRPAEEDA